MVDLIIRNGTFPSDEQNTALKLDIAVDDGRITGIGELEQDCKQDIDARGLHVLPGMIDTHVHFNDPGRTTWEGIATGSRAFASGGGTLYGDMPLNASPPTLDADSFAAKLAVAQRDSVTDFALWGGLTPTNLEHMEALANCGVFAFKAFMSNSGMDDFQAADDATLYEGMVTATKLNLPVAVHAESDALTAHLSQQMISAGKLSPQDYAASRPVTAEVEAIRRAVSLAEATGCKLHIVHVSSGTGVLEVARARARGVDITCETCAHYLHFTEEDLFNFGAILKCAPPLRSEVEQQRLWQCIREGQVNFVTSDHSPSSLDLKDKPDFFEVWGGIAGVEATLLVMLNGMTEHNLTTEDIANLTAGRAAARFGFKDKGRLEVGAHADIVLVDLVDETARKPDNLLSRHKYSPYTSPYTQPLRGRIVSTFVRGQRVFHEDNIVEGVRGQLIKPGHA
ncbi:MAG: allantoinase AllB [Deinococcota bacterium]